jgi:peptidyl-prolyl cis-trans isomerase B (cyclophilin B)
MTAIGCSKPFEPLDAAGVEARKEAAQAAEAVPVEDGEIAVLDVEYNSEKGAFSGTITFEFLTDVAPNHSANFKRLANCGFYDGTTFHRVIPGFMIQGGDVHSAGDDPTIEGQGNPGYSINAEFNATPHDRGIVSMARSNNPNSGGSQFFICHAAANQLDGQYSVFGRVIDGLDLVDKIANVSRNERDRPNDPVRMVSVRVEKQ